MYRATYKATLKDVFGSGKIGSFNAGAITRADGSPVATRVVAFISGRNRPIAETFSDESGDWVLDNIDLRYKYFVRIRDESRQLNGAVLDWIQPVAMD